MSDIPKIKDLHVVLRTCVGSMPRNDTGRQLAAVHERACPIGHFERALDWKDRDGFVAFVAGAVRTRSRPSHPINAISVAEDVAVVQVMHSFQGGHCDDTFTLLNHESRWRMVPKIFCFRPSAPADFAAQGGTD